MVGNKSFSKMYVYAGYFVLCYRAGVDLVVLSKALFMYVCIYIYIYTWYMILGE